MEFRPPVAQWFHGCPPGMKLPICDEADLWPILPSITPARTPSIGTGGPSGYRQDRAASSTATVGNGETRSQPPDAMARLAADVRSDRRVDGGPPGPRRRRILERRPTRDVAPAPIGRHSERAEAARADSPEPGGRGGNLPVLTFAVLGAAVWNPGIFVLRLNPQRRPNRPRAYPGEAQSRHSFGRKRGARENGPNSVNRWDRSSCRGRDSNPQGISPARF